MTTVHRHSVSGLLRPDTMGRLEGFVAGDTDDDSALNANDEDTGSRTIKPTKSIKDTFM